LDWSVLTKSYSLNHYDILKKHYSTLKKEKKIEIFYEEFFLNSKKINNIIIIFQMLHYGALCQNYIHMLKTIFRTWQGERGTSLYGLHRYMAMRTVLVYRAVTKYVTLNNAVEYKI